MTLREALLVGTLAGFTRCKKGCLFCPAAEADFIAYFGGGVS